jgi:tripartite-type tricarboxylate transporter receptor subunit TctC
VTDSVRDAVVAPEIPTLAELGVPGVVVTSWYGVLAPAGTPPEVVAQVLKDATDALARPEVREQLRSQGLTPVLMKPVEFAAHIKAETATWASIIKARNIVAE